MAYKEMVLGMVNSLMTIEDALHKQFHAICINY